MNSAQVRLVRAQPGAEASTDFAASMWIIVTRSLFGRGSVELERISLDCAQVRLVRPTPCAEASMDIVVWKGLIVTRSPFGRGNVELDLLTSQVNLSL